MKKTNTKGDENNEFKVGQTVFKKNPQARSKKSNKFIGPYTITQLLNRNRVEITSKSNPNKKEIIHIKELKQPPRFSDFSPSPSPK